jgi:hypothetical protein
MNGNARSIYSSFTSIAFISVLSWVAVRQHKRSKTCDKCYEIDQDSPRSLKTRSDPPDVETMVCGFIKDPVIQPPRNVAQPERSTRFDEWV